MASIAGATVLLARAMTFVISTLVSGIGREQRRCCWPLQPGKNVSVGKRVMVTRINKFGVGIDVGWQILSPTGEMIELWPMNTRDDESLARLILDAKSRYGEFDVELGHYK